MRVPSDRAALACPPGTTLASTPPTTPPRASHPPRGETPPTATVDARSTRPGTPDSPLPGDLPALAALVAQLLNTVQRLDARVRTLERDHHAPRAGPRDDADIQVLVAIAASVGSVRFTSAQLFRDARSERAPELADALLAADIDSVRALGKLLARLEGCTIEGLRLERVEVGRTGIWWRVVVVPQV